MNIIQAYYVRHVVIIMWPTSVSSCVTSLSFINHIRWPHGIVKCPLFAHRISLEVVLFSTLLWVLWTYLNCFSPIYSREVCDPFNFYLICLMFLLTESLTCLRSKWGYGLWDGSRWSIHVLKFLFFYCKDWNFSIICMSCLMHTWKL